MARSTQEILKKANGSARDLVSQLQSAEAELEKMSHDAGERLGEFASGIADRTQDALKTSQKYVKENPGKSVALAAAVGAMTGGLIVALRRKH